MTLAAQSRAFLGLSHTPLLGLASLSEATEKELLSAIEAMKSRVLDWAPDRVVLIAPDHYNGFFHELMPPFCVGTQASSVGDYLMPKGELNVDEAVALGMTAFLMGEGFDLSISRRMRVDHGFVQPLLMMWNEFKSPPVVPVFLNALARPTIPRVGRCLQLGEAIGRFLDTLPGRTLVIGSGGLSHEPPAPDMSHPDPQVRERITVRVEPTPDQRQERMQKAVAAGLDLANGAPGTKALNPQWDRRWMDALEAGDWGYFADMTEDSIDEWGGRSAHESKTWLVGRRALLGKATRTELRHYQAIPELIAGFGVMLMVENEEGRGA